MRRPLRRVAVALSVVVVVAIGATLLINRHLSAAPWVGPVSSRFDGRRFSNLEPQTDKGLGDVLRWQLGDSDKGRWAKWIDELPGAKPPERVDDGSIRVTWVNHATLLVQMDGVNVLTDPTWSDRTSPISWLGPRRHRAPGLRLEDLPPLDAVVVSHNHYDHMDVPTLARLRERGAPIVTGLGNAAYLARFAVDSVRDVDWWSSVELAPGVRLIAVPVQHWSARSRSDRRHTLWAGYVIEGPSGRVYFGGDTGYGGHFALVRQRLGPIDVALLPIGAFLPIWFMRESHMSPREALSAVGDLEATVAIPMHFDTWQLGNDGDREPLDSLEAALRDRPEVRARVRVLRHGIGESFRSDGKRNTRSQ